MAIQEEGLVETLHALLGFRCFYTNHNTVGFQEVIHGTPLLQKFGIGSHVKIQLCPTLL